ncbi:MAG: hypothetical protein QXP39_02710, partial [Candidatus Aenigmatarchaeota archaeon]
TWLKDLGTIILFAIPVGRAGKVIKKGAERVLVGTVEKVSTSLTKAGAKMFKRISGHLTEKGVSQKVIAVFSRSAEKLERRAALEGLKEADITLFNAIKNKLESLKNVKKIMKVAGVATTSALVAAWIDSVNEKYIPQPGNLVLKRPYKDLDTESINTATKPVLLDKPGLTSDIKGHVNFYLASPCSANITIKEDWAKCEQYGYDALEGTVYCNSSIWTELAFGLPECNFSKDIVDSQSITPIYDKIDSIIKGDMSFFEEKKINIPWLDGYLTDMPETSGTARLWINEKLELKNVLWRDTYILNKDRVYRIYIYNTSTGNIILDIYPNDTCESVISENPEPYKSISCDELRKEPKGQLKSPDQIKSLIQTVKDKREKDIIEVKPTNSIKANEIIIEGYKFSTDCSEGNNKICIRSAEVSMWKDEERYWFFPNKRSCIDINMSGEEKVYLYNDDVNYFLDWGCEEQFRTVVPSGYGIAYKYYPTTILVFKNMTSDTTWDYLQIQFIKGGVGDFPENTTIGLADISGGKANLFTMDRCKTPAIYLRPEKNEVEDHNFCYSEPATWTKVVFVATLIADVALTTFGAGVGVSIAVGLTGGVVYVMTEKAEKWP